MSDSAPTHFIDVRTITVPVSDQQRALEFYTQKLGLQTRMDVAYGEGQRWIEVAVPGSTTTISLACPDREGATGVDTGIRFRTADASRDYEELRSRGVTLEGEVLRWPGVPPMFTLRDLDGNRLYVVEDMAAAGQGERRMTLKRFVVFVKANTETETGVLPTEEELDAMTRFNQGLADSGALLAIDGFHASRDGVRLRFGDGDVTVERGPFQDPGSLVAGYWSIQAGSIDEVIDAMRRAPMGKGMELEVRQVLEAEEFGDAFTPELREREARQQARMEANARRGAA